jgi:RNA polymerase sigma-54 factor
MQSIELRTKLFLANNLQLEALVRQQLSTNLHALEADLTGGGEDLSALEQQEYQQDQSFEEFTGYKMSADGYEHDVFRTLSNPVSEAEHLAEQLHYAPLSEHEKQVGAHILASLDERGYFKENPDDFIRMIKEREGIEITSDRLEKVLGVVRSLDPPGLGSRSLKEFYQANLAALPQNKVTNLAHTVVTHCFDYFQNRRFDRIADRLQIDDAYTKGVLTESVDLIQKLPKTRSMREEPKITQREDQQPDVIIRRHLNRLRVTVSTPRIVRSLHIRKDWEPLLNPRGLKSNNPEVRRRSLEHAQFVKSQLQPAQEFLTLCNTRKKLMEKFFQILATEQEAYFLSGDPSKLKPLQQRDMVEHPALIKIVSDNFELLPKEDRDFADKVSFSASMVSTLVNNKSIETDFGVIGVKTLFDKKFDKSQDVAVTRRQVDAVVAAALKKEDRAQPLTDDRIAQVIQEEFKEAHLQVDVKSVQNMRKRLSIPDTEGRQDVRSIIDSQLDGRIKPIQSEVFVPATNKSEGRKPN